MRHGQNIHHYSRRALVYMMDTIDEQQLKTKKEKENGEIKSEYPN